jgi:RNA polymerase sigma-70 factor (ECF subfamily)
MNMSVELSPPLRADESRQPLADLLLRIADGDHVAFADFYALTSREVFGRIRRVVIDLHLSEEVTREVFIVVWRDAVKYAPSLGSPTAWLMMIAHRRAVDTVRSSQSSRNRDDRWAVAGAGSGDTVGDTVAQRSDAVSVMSSLACLSVLQREAIELAYFGCLTYREVSEKLAIPLPTVTSRIRDGLQKLRLHLEPA